MKYVSFVERLPVDLNLAPADFFAIVLLALLSFPVAQSFAQEGASGAALDANILQKVAQENYDFNTQEQNRLQSESAESAELNYAVGLAILNSSESKAREYFQRALDIKVNLGMMAAKEHNSLGYLNYLAGELEEAEKNYSKAIQEAKASDDTQLRIKIYNNMANLKMELGDLDKASSYASTSSSLGSHYSKTILAAIQSLDHLDEPDRKFYRLMDEGVSYRKNKKFGEAIIYYDQALEIRPENYRALNFKGYALIRLDRFDEAEKVLEKGVMVVDGYPPIGINLVKAYCSNNKLTKAREFMLQFGTAKNWEEFFEKDYDLRKRCKALKDYRGQLS
jgi:tetratricopeptide (TPR) repeat protein